jgi:molybdate transport system ATP-binding protein
MSEIRLQLDLARNIFNLKVDLHLPAQGISVIYGLSGSGKTTLLRCVAGLETHARGLVQVGSDIWQHDSAGVYLPTFKRPLGFVFQEASLFVHLDVADNLSYGLRRGHAHNQKIVLDEAIALLGIGDLLQRRTDQLSGGERQRVAIARALATQPKLLLLDEPLASLDSARKQDILPWLEKLRDELKIPMLYVTHAADEVVRLADTLVVRESGQVRAVGPVTEVLSSIDLPLVVGDDVGALIEGYVHALDKPWHLAQINLSESASGMSDDSSLAFASLWVRDNELQVGQSVRLRVLARDVSITLEEAHHTSIQNHLPCVVESIHAESHPSQVLLRLRCGEVFLLARVTARGAHGLGLQVGMKAWAQVKSAALVK